MGFRPADLRVVPYEDAEHRQLWEAFLERSATGNLFQSRRFLDYHPAGRFVDASLLFFEGDQLRAIAAGEAADGAWSGHRFTSHGGLAIEPGARADLCLSIVHALFEVAERRGWQRLRMRYAPDGLQGEGAMTLYWALAVGGFTEDGRELGWIIPTGRVDEEALLSSYDDGTRRGVRKAQREGLVFGAADGDEEWLRYWELLNATLRARFDTVPTHSLQELARLRELCAGEMELWTVVDSDGRLCAGSVVFTVGPDAAHCFYFAQDYERHALRPMNLLFHGLAVEYTLRRGQRLNLGVITAYGAQELNLGLARFKQNFGAQPTIRRTFLWDQQA